MIVMLLALTAAAPLPPPADPVGLWKTPRGATVALARCGDRLCGRIVAVPPLTDNPRGVDRNNKDPAKRDRPLKGLTMLSGLSGGPETWTGGRVYNPEDGGSYSASIAMDGANTLKMKGCLAAFLCRTQVWTRAR